MVARWPQVPVLRPRPQMVGQAQHEIGFANQLAGGVDGVGCRKAAVKSMKPVRPLLPE